MDELDNNLKNLFCTAANSVTQIYMKSLENQKESYNVGVKDTIENVADFIEKNSTKVQGKTIIDVEKLLDFLKNQNKKKEGNWNEQRETTSTPRNIPSSDNSWKQNEPQQQQNGWIQSPKPSETFNFNNNETKPFIFQPHVFQENTNMESSD
eukprot:gene12486-6234_t